MTTEVELMFRVCVKVKIRVLFCINAKKRLLTSPSNILTTQAWEKVRMNNTEKIIPNYNCGMSHQYVRTRPFN